MGQEQRKFWDKTVPKMHFGKTGTILVIIFEYLALNYLSRGPPLKYCRSCNVSQPSSGWVGVVPLQREYKVVCTEKNVFCTVVTFFKKAKVVPKFLLV